MYKDSQSLNYCNFKNRTVFIYRGHSQDFPFLGGGGSQVIVFIKKCSLLVDRLGRTSSCYIEVEQKGGLPPWLCPWISVFPAPVPPSNLNTFLYLCFQIFGANEGEQKIGFAAAGSSSAANVRKIFIYLRRFPFDSLLCLFLFFPFLLCSVFSLTSLPFPSRHFTLLHFTCASLDFACWTLSTTLILTYALNVSLVSIYSPLT